jgi:hypothetical protein
MIKRTFSFSSLSKEDLVNVSKKTFQRVSKVTDITGKVLVEFSRMMANAMSSSKGRNKICGLIQYAAKMKYYCNIHSNIPEVREAMRKLHEMKPLMSARIATTMSKNKKIFKFLKFIDEFYKLNELAKNKKKHPKFLLYMLLMSKVGSFFYCILDNFLWAINTGIFSKGILNF